MKRIDIPERWRRRAIVVSAGPVPMTWFSTEELRLMEAFRLPKRREEFLLSRAAAKALACDLGLAQRESECRIDDRRVGSHFLSLSHSAPYAAAAIDSAPIGIDAQVVRALTENAAHLFLTPGEEEAMHASTIADRIIHFWCAKEASWKRHGGAIETLKRVPLSFPETSDDGLRFADVETLRVDDLVVALTLPSA